MIFLLLYLGNDLIIIDKLESSSISHSILRNKIEQGNSIILGILSPVENIFLPAVSLSILITTLHLFFDGGGLFTAPFSGGKQMKGGFTGFCHG